MKNIYLIMGKSGTGKSAIIKELAVHHGCRELLSYTTRQQRNADDNTHVFISEDEYFHLENIVADTCFDGHYYCATEEQVENSDLYAIDVPGVKSFYHRYIGNKPVVVVYITASVPTRFARMMRRGDGAFGAVRRLIHDRKAFADAERYADIIIDNNGKNDLSDVVEDLYHTMEEYYE